MKMADAMAILTSDWNSLSVALQQLIGVMHTKSNSTPAG
jgi:hypothetical protein